MKSRTFILSILSVLILAAWVVASQTPAQKSLTPRPSPPIVEQIDWQAQPEPIEQAVVQFNEPVKLLGVILKGSYMFVHNESRMARGEPCSSVYARGETGKYDQLIVSFHCVPVIRETPAEEFSVVISPNSPAMGLKELVEYRFAGGTEGHQVPQGAE